MTLIPNLIPLVSVIPKIYNQEVDYMQGIQYTIYCLIGVFVPLILIGKSEAISKSIMYKLTYKEDIVRVVKLVGIVIIIFSLLTLLKINYSYNYSFSIRFIRVIGIVTGSIIYFKSQKINFNLQRYYKIAEEKNRSEDDPWK